MQYDEYEVPCEACGCAGKVSHFVFLTRDCRVCNGTGNRKVYIAANLSPADREMVLRASCISAANLRALA